MDKDIKDKSRIAFTRIAIILVVAVIVGGIFLQISNRNTARSVADRYKSGMESVNQLETSECRDIPEGWLNEYGKENRSDAILYCQDRLADGSFKKIRQDIIDSAKNEYAQEIRKKGGLYEVSNFIMCIALYCPVQDIDKSL